MPTSAFGLLSTGLRIYLVQQVLGYRLSPALFGPWLALQLSCWLCEAGVGLLLVTFGLYLTCVCSTAAASPLTQPVLLPSPCCCPAAYAARLHRCLAGRGRQLHATCLASPCGGTSLPDMPCGCLPAPARHPPRLHRAGEAYATQPKGSRPQNKTFSENNLFIRPSLIFWETWFL